MGGDKALQNKPEQIQKANKNLAAMCKLGDFDFTIVDPKMLTKDSNATEEAIAATKNAASKISILIGEKAHELKEAATPLAKDAMEKAGELKEKATPMLEQAIERAKELKEKLMNGDNTEDNTSK